MGMADWTVYRCLVTGPSGRLHDGAGISERLLSALTLKRASASISEIFDAEPPYTPRGCCRTSMERSGSAAQPGEYYDGGLILAWLQPKYQTSNFRFVMDGCKYRAILGERETRSLPAFRAVGTPNPHRE